MVSLKLITDLQDEINKIRQGSCILLKVINYDELISLLGVNNNIMQNLQIMINEISIYHLLQPKIFIFNNHLLILLPTIIDLQVEEIVDQIYFNAQLYTNLDYPEAYINSHLAAIQFKPKQSHDAEKIYRKLLGIIACSQHIAYDGRCNAKSYNIELLKNNHIKLNLLRKALLNNNLRFMYQPIIDHKTQSVVYHECLLRICDTKNNLISVGPIIHHAEERGIMSILDKAVLEMTILELAKNKSLTLSVNISSRGVLDNKLLILAKKLLEKYDVAKRLIIEITETAINQNYTQTKLFIQELHHFGCRFALDDFGSGFTSFKQIYSLPIDIIKIDGSYIRNLTTDIYSQHFVKAVVSLSEKIGIKTVAEFVENGKIAKLLIDIKVDGLQGNFFATASTKKTKKVNNLALNILKN